MICHSTVGNEPFAVLGKEIPIEGGEWAGIVPNRLLRIEPTVFAMIAHSVDIVA